MSKYTRQRSAFKAISPVHLVKDRLPYIDKVQVWLPARLPTDKIRALEGLCGFVHVHDKPMMYQPRWKQRLQLNQPSDGAFSYLDQVTDGRDLVNYAEFALDLIARDAREVEKLEEFLQTHLVLLSHKIQYQEVF